MNIVFELAVRGIPFVGYQWFLKCPGDSEELKISEVFDTEEQAWKAGYAWLTLLAEGE